MDGSWNDSTILEVGSSSIHGECLSSTSLTIAHDCTVVPLNDRLHNIFGAVLENVFLGSVMHNLVEFELPGLLLIVDETSSRILWNMNRHVLKKLDETQTFTY